VAKLSIAGNTLVYSTYLGGSGGNDGTGIAVDPHGHAHVTGWTWSSDFPTQNPLQAVRGGGVSMPLWPSSTQRVQRSFILPILAGMMKIGGWALPWILAATLMWLGTHGQKIFR
jgi:hypothetical protein